eukprot:116794_1
MKCKTPPTKYLSKDDQIEKRRNERKLKLEKLRAKHKRKEKKRKEKQKLKSLEIDHTKRRTSKNDISAKKSRSRANDFQKVKKMNVNQYKKKRMKTSKHEQRKNILIAAQIAINKTRKTLNMNKQDSSFTLTKGKQAYMPDNIIKALKSLPSISRRKLESKIRKQLMTEQTINDLKKVKKQLTENHAVIVEKQKALNEEKEDNERKMKRTQQIKQINDMRKDILFKEKHGHAEIARQMKQLEDDRKRFLKSQRKLQLLEAEQLIDKENKKQQKQENILKAKKK